MPSDTILNFVVAGDNDQRGMVSEGMGIYPPNAISRCSTRFSETL